MRYSNRLGPAGYPPVSMTHRICELLRSEIAGASMSVWRSKRSFFDPAMPRILRPSSCRQRTRNEDGWEPFLGFRE